jgi:hypothetical protein
MKNTVGAKVAIGVCALVMGIAVWAQPGQPDAPAVPAAVSASAAADVGAQGVPAILASAQAPVPVASAPAVAAPAPLTRPALVAQSSLNGADTAWMMTATALVLLMTLPGIALFYGGMVRKKSVINTMASVVAIAAVVTLLWFAFGYSLAFTPGNGWIGGTSRFWFEGLSYLKDAGEGVGQPHRPEHSGIGVLNVPADLCHHHAGTDCWCVRGADEVFGDAVVHRALVPAGVRTCGALGLGTGGLDRADGRAGFCRWHGGACQRRHRRPDVCVFHRTAAGAMVERPSSRSTSA